MPAEVNPRCFHISASSIAAFKRCPNAFRLAYREGLRSNTDTESQRVGTNWHSLHEVYANNLSAGGTEDTALTAAIDHINAAYQDLPEYKSLEEWDLERQILVTCFIGYLWHWQSDPVKFLHSELPFDLPVHNHLGLPLRIDEALRVGKIDHVIEWRGGIGALERKSTTRSIDPAGDYWRKSQKDTQVSMYALAFQDMLRSGTLPQDILNHELFKQEHRFGNCLYDVWHRPTIKPAVLTQGETDAFINGREAVEAIEAVPKSEGVKAVKAVKGVEAAEKGVYCGQKFEVSQCGVEPDGIVPFVLANGTKAQVTMGAKGFAIRETNEMYAARLLSDIYERPDFYFQRKEIARTDAELKEFRGEIFNIYQSMKSMSKNKFFFSNESACDATFKCAYISICYGPGAAAVCDGKTTPDGYKRIFVDLTVNGVEQDE